MKSGACGSSWSAMTATFTPAPVAMSAALGVPSALAACTVASACGSSSGLAGSAGHSAFGGWRLAAFGLAAPPLGLRAVGVVTATLRSGTTEATAGSRLSAAACAPVTVAAKALPSV